MVDKRIFRLAEGTSMLYIQHRIGEPVCKVYPIYNFELSPIAAQFNKIIRVFDQYHRGVYNIARVSHFVDIEGRRSDSSHPERVPVYFPLGMTLAPHLKNQNPDGNLSFVVWRLPLDAWHITRWINRPSLWQEIIVHSMEDATADDLITIRGKKGEFEYFPSSARKGMLDLNK